MKEGILVWLPLIFGEEYAIKKYIADGGALKVKNINNVDYQYTYQSRIEGRIEGRSPNFRYKKDIIYDVERYLTEYDMVFLHLDKELMELLNKPERKVYTILPSSECMDAYAGRLLRNDITLDVIKQQLEICNSIDRNKNYISEFPMSNQIGALRFDLIDWIYRNFE